MSSASEPSNATGAQQAREGAMTVRGAVFMGVGSMVGAGIFALLGEAGAVAGAAVWLSFLIAGMMAMLQGYAVAKLGARYPSSGGIVTAASDLLALHHGPGFVLPNAWDPGSARILEQVGFPAIATTSAGIAWSCGVPDGGALGVDTMLEHVGRIAASVGVPPLMRQCSASLIRSMSLSGASCRSPTSMR